MGLLGGLGPMVNGVMWMQTALAFIFVVARIYTRRFIIRSLGWDDILIVVSLVRWIFVS